MLSHIRLCLKIESPIPSSGFSSCFPSKHGNSPSGSHLNPSMTCLLSFPPPTNPVGQSVAGYHVLSPLFGDLVLAPFQTSSTSNLQGRPLHPGPFGGVFFAIYVELSWKWLVFFSQSSIWKSYVPYFPWNQPSRSSSVMGLCPLWNPRHIP